MRDYTGIAPSTIPPPGAPNFQNRLRDMLSEVDYFLRDLNRGMARIQLGEIPDGSGNEIGNNGTLTNYWFKPGISDPFTAYMSKSAGAGGTISSTAHDSKGKILFGGSTAYDEANVRLGIGTTYPSAMLHIASSASSIYARPTATSGSIGSWRGQDGGTTNLQNYVNETTADDAAYVTEPAGPGTALTYVLWTAGNIPFTGSPTITMRFRVKRVLPSAGTEQFHFDLYRAATLVTAQNSGVLGTTFVDYSYTLSAGEVTSLFNAGADGCTIDIYAVGLGTNGYDVSYLAMEISTGTAQTLARWDTNGTQSGRITTEGYLESQRLNLTGTASGTVTLTGGSAPTSHTYILPTAQGAASTLLQNDGAGQLSWATGSSVVDVARTWTTLQKFPDDKFNIVGSADATKIARFEVDGLSAGTNVFTLPATAADTIAVLGLAQSFTATKTFTVAPKIDIASAATGFVWTATDNDGNGVWQAASGGTSFADNVFDVHDEIDVTKRLLVSLGGATAGSDTTLTSVATADRVITLPNVTGSLPTLENAHTVSGAWVLGDLGNFINVGVDSTGGVGGYGLKLYDGSGFTANLGFSTGLSADIVLNLPLTSGQLIGTTDTATVTGKTMGGASGISRIRCGVATENTLFLNTSGSTTNAFRIQTVDLSGTRQYRVANLTASFVMVGDDPPTVAAGALGKVDLTAQVGNIVTTNLSSTPPAGIYEVEVYILTTTADVTAGTQAVVIGWTDNVGATTETIIAAHTLVTTGRTKARVLVRVNSADITYAVTNTGGYGTAAYAIYVRVVALG